MTEKLAPILMCAVFAAIAYGLMRLTLKISSAAARKKILSYGRPSEDAAAALLCSYFGETRVLSGVWLLCDDAFGKKQYEDADDIIVLDSCIVSVEIKSLVGKIYSGDSDTWHQSVITRTGERKEFDFENPIEANERHIEALKAVLKKENLPCPKIHNIVIFTSKKAVISDTYPEVFRLDDGIGYIRSLSKGKKFSARERLAIIRAIRRNSAKSARARAFNDKKRRI